MKKQHEKMMMDLQRLMAAQDFQSEDQLRAFMTQMLGKQVPSFPEEALNVSEQAEDLVLEAYELPAAKAKAKVNKALKLDPDCIHAYEFMGIQEKIAEKAIPFFEKGITIGRKKFGGEYLKIHKGLFWGFHETRPFMRCMQNYADCLYTIGNVKESVAILEEMIELNSNDNQGIRDQLLLFLIQLGENDKFVKYAQMFKKDSLAFPLFNRALFAFKTEGDSKNAVKQLLKAHSSNKHVAKRILSNKLITHMPEYYSIGDENEADYVAQQSQIIWKKTEGALDWLKKHT